MILYFRFGASGNKTVFTYRLMFVCTYVRMYVGFIVSVCTAIALEVRTYVRTYLNLCGFIAHGSSCALLVPTRSYVLQSFMLHS